MCHVNDPSKHIYGYSVTRHLVKCSLKNNPSTFHNFLYVAGITKTIVIHYCTVYVAHLPYLSTQLDWWDVKCQHKLEPPEESLVQVINEVGGENDDPRETLNMVQKNTDINVGITIS